MGQRHARLPSAPERTTLGRTDAALLAILLAASTDVRARLGRDDGQAFVEYALVLLLVAITIAAATFVTPFGSMAEGAFSTIANALGGGTD